MAAQQPSSSSARHHTRNVSSDDRRRVAMPRRSTKGPLDAPDAQQIQQAQPEQRPLPSPPISPQESSARPLSFDFPDKDFSFLLRPEIYHSLSYLDTPPPLRSSALQAPQDTPIPELLSTGHFRDASIVSAQNLTKTNPPPPASEIFSLLYTRLATLTLTNNTTLAAQEVKVLSDLSSPFYLSPSNNAHIVPWELRVLAVRLQSLGHGDWRHGVSAYYELAREARRELGRSEEKQVWKIRLKDLGIRVANALVEMGDLEAAARHLRTLRLSQEDGASTEERQREALVWLRLGDVPSARDCLHVGDTGDREATRDDSELEALCDMADGQYVEAVGKWRRLQRISAGKSSSGSEMIQQNLAVCLLYTGQVNEARQLLDSLLTISDNTRPFPALTFNLCTIYELCSEKSRALKLALAEKIAAKAAETGGASADSASQSWKGWKELSNADFKL